MTLYPKLIVDALATVVYPGTKKNLIESEMLADTPSIDGMNVRIVLVFPRDTDPFLRSTVKAAEAAIHYHISPDVKVTIETEFK
jgi:ATP-binding protein involved in chromosome partitioning